jgi:cysteinyl-tRNA synthetase
MDIAAGAKGPEGRVAERDEFLAAMDDDFNTPKALSVIYDLVNECNKLMEGGGDDKKSALRAARDFIREAMHIFGLEFAKDTQASEDEMKLLKERITARQKKDFRKSDELRDLLKAKGIIVEDTKEGQIWRRA